MSTEISIVNGPNLHEDTFSVICSFLKPTELCRVRRLNSMYKNWVDSFLSLKFKMVSIQDFVCPKCGSWIADIVDECYDLSDYNGFYNIYNNDVDEEESRIDYINTLLYNKNITRKALLCEDCEYDEVEEQTINFRFSGDRKYTLHVIEHYVYPWSFLVLENNNTYFWNEYRLVIPYPEDTYNDYDYDYYEYTSRLIEEWRERYIERDDDQLYIDEADD
jgi:hypothetical protein